MDLPDLIREAIAAGRLREPFSAREAAKALHNPEWPLPLEPASCDGGCPGDEDKLVSSGGGAPRRR